MPADMEEFEEQKYGKRLMYSCFAAHKAQDIFSQQLIVTNGDGDVPALGRPGAHRAGDR